MPSHELPVSDHHEELGYPEACAPETGERSASLRPGLTKRGIAVTGAVDQRTLDRLRT